MKILIFNSSNLYDAVTYGIQNRLKKFYPCQVIVTSEQGSFKSAFWESLSGETIVVYCILNMSELFFLESIHTKFVDVKLIIVIRNKADDQYDRVLKLFPRMISTIEDAPFLVPEGVFGLVKENFKNRQLPFQE